MNFIPYGRQNISKEDIQAVIETLNSGWLTQGPAVKHFEEQLKSYCSVSYTFAVCNATAALHLAYLALDVKKGDIVWTSPNTFLSTTNAALMCGAEVDFVDICPQTYNLCVDALGQKLIEADRKGKLPKVVTPVHFAGQSCNMREIHKLAQQYGFKIVEDAAHAVGGKYLEKAIGSCLYSDICVFSFHPVKIITTGEGGALFTNNEKLAQKIGLLRTHGMTRNQELMTKETDGPWYYQMIELGFNYRITDLQCALGLSQLQRLDEFVAKRHKIKEQYGHLLSDHNEIVIPKQYEDSYSALHLYPIQVDSNKRKALFEFLRASNIGVNVHYIPVYLQPYYQKLGFKQGYCPNAEKYYASAISLPMFFDLSDEQVKYVVDKLIEGLK